MLSLSCEKGARLGKTVHDTFRRGHRPFSRTSVQRKSFRDSSHLTFYASANKRQRKAAKRLEGQRDRLKDLSGQLGTTAGSDDLGLLATVVAELKELNSAVSLV